MTTRTENPMTQPTAAPAALEPPRFETGRPLLIAGLRGHFTTANWAGIPALWQRFAAYIGNIPGQVERVAYGLCFNLSNGIDYVTGVEVSSATGLPAEFITVNIPPQKYAVFAHRGHVSKLHDTMELIGQWLQSSGYKVVHTKGEAPDFFERYGEGFNPQTGMGDIEVWIPIE